MDSIKFLSDLAFYRTYSAKKEDGTKETWDETVGRYEGMLLRKFPQLEDNIKLACALIKHKYIVPSMRALQFAGSPIESCNNRLFNCSYLPVTDFIDFAETMYLLMCGSGVGLGIQSWNICKMPVIADGWEESTPIKDSKEGWADSIKELLFNPEVTFDYSEISPEGTPITCGTASGPAPLIQTHANIRRILRGAKGRRLTAVECADIYCFIGEAVVVGGVRRSAGIILFDQDEMLLYKTPGYWTENPQRSLVNVSKVFIREELTQDKFNEAFDFMVQNNTGEPGFLLLNSRTSGTNPCQPAFATVLTPEGIKTFADIDEGSIIWSGKQWTKVIKKWSTGVKEVYAYCTERGVFVGTPNHRVVEKGVKVEARLARFIDCFVDDVHWRDATEPEIIQTHRIDEITSLGKHEVFDITVEAEEHTYWTGGCLVSNCGEAILRPYTFCNLTEVNYSKIETAEELALCAGMTAFLGVLQSTFTDFKYLRERWKRNTEEDRLLGVSLTGIAQNFVFGEDVPEVALIAVKNIVQDTCEKLGLNLPKRITLVKPSGTTSAVLGTSSGIHAPFSEYHIRRVRIDKGSPVAKALTELCVVASAGEGWFIEEDMTNSKNYVVSIPVHIKARMYADSESAIDALKRIMKINVNWIHPLHREGEDRHNCSATVYYKPEEIDEIKEFLWEHNELYTGISLFPYSDSNLPQLPFEKISKEKYEELVRLYEPFMIDLSGVKYDGEADGRGGEAACAGGACEFK